jgi:hypothetical protein
LLTRSAEEVTGSIDRWIGEDDKKVIIMSHPEPVTESWEWDLLYEPPRAELERQEITRQTMSILAKLGALR